MLPDVVVVGGGPVGLMVGLAARREGFHVTIVDARAPIPMPWDTPPTVLAPLASRPLSVAGLTLALDAWSRWEAWRGEWAELETAQVGSPGLVALPHDPAGWATLLEIVRSEPGRAIRVEPLSDEGLRQAVPGVVGGRGLWYPDWITLLPSRAYAALYRLTRVRGVVFQWGEPPLAVEVRGRRARGVRLPGRVLPGGVVVLATNAASMRLMDGLGWRLPVRRATKAVIRLQPSSLWPYPVTGGGVSLVPGPAGELALAGDGRKPPADVTAGEAARLLSAAVQFNGTLDDARLLDWTTISFGATPDGLPVWGWWPELDGLFLAAGLGEGGWLLGPLLADAAAALLQRAPVPLDVAPYRPERFGAQGLA
jgi:glycine/D-amino acid oxidase-like deaminating enzyme